MNYLQEILNFERLQDINRLSPGQARLWYVLMYVNNVCGWRKWFTIASSSLEFRCGLSRGGIIKARNELKRLGYIDFKTNGRKATSYHMISLMQHSTHVGVQDSVHVSTHTSVQDSTHTSTQDSTHVGVQDGVALNKQNKTKQNKTKKEKEKRSSAELNRKFETEFETIWKVYPNKSNKKDACRHYIAWRKAGTKAKPHEPAYLSKQLGLYKQLLALQSWRHPMNGSTWFNGRFDDDYQSQINSARARANPNQSEFEREAAAQDADLPF